MAASFKSGKKGKVEVGSTNMRVQGWNYEPKNDLQDITNSESLGAEEWLAGIDGGSVSFNALWDIDGHPTNDPPNLKPGIKVTLKLYLGDTAKFFQLDAFIETLPVVSEVKGTLKFTCNARQHGVVTYPTG